MRSTTLTAAVLAGSAALAAAAAHRRRTAPPPVDLAQVIVGARRGTLFTDDFTFIPERSACRRAS